MSQDLLTEWLADPNSASDEATRAAREFVEVQLARMAKAGINGGRPRKGEKPKLQDTEEPKLSLAAPQEEPKLSNTNLSSAETKPKLSETPRVKPKLVSGRVYAYTGTVSANATEYGEDESYVKDDPLDCSSVGSTGGA